MTPRLREAIERPVSVAEVRAALERPIPAEERQEVLALVTWFTTRYRSPLERLMYVRRAYARWRSTP